MTPMRTVKGNQAATTDQAAPPAAIELVVQTRDKDGKAVKATIGIVPAKTAVVAIDMWDRHWCKTHAARVGNMAPRMNRVLDACRKLGVQVVFAPSDVVNFYKDFPQRRAMQAIPAHCERKLVPFNPPAPPPPIDNCECGPSRPCRSAGVWTRQCADLAITAKDLIGDGNNGARAAQSLRRIAASTRCSTWAQPATCACFIGSSASST